MDEVFNSRKKTKTGSTSVTDHSQFINEVNSKAQRACYSVTVCQIYACYSNTPAIYCLSPPVLVIDTSLCFVTTSADRKLTLREWPSGWYIGEDSWAHLRCFYLLRCFYHSRQKTVECSATKETLLAWINWRNVSRGACSQWKWIATVSNGG